MLNRRRSRNRQHDRGSFQQPCQRNLLGGLILSLGDALKQHPGHLETKLIDTSALEELNPYKFFEAASLYTARLVNPEQARAVISTAIRTAILEKGPTVLAIPGDVASADAPDQPTDL